MIDQNCFSVASEHIFLNVSNCETAMVCIPVVCEKDINVEVAALFKRILFSTQFDNNEDSSYIAQLITYINGGAAFNVYGFKDLVTKHQSGGSMPVQTPSPAQSVPMQTQVPSTPQAAPVSSFDSTITMDEMNALMSQKKTQPPVNNKQSPLQNASSSVASVHPVTQVPPVSQPSAPSQTMPPAGRPISGNTPPQVSVKSQAAPVAQKPPVQNSVSFAIPGQQMVNLNKPQSAVPEAQQKKAEPTGDKKMSFFGLLSHYNKENAELYKKQREEAKAKKAANKNEAKSVQPAGGTKPAQQNAVTPQQPVPQYNQPIHPIPVQNSFNETTVLDASMFGGETTVLGATPGVPDPCLVRVKTGERIKINKPVFRIGKEKSYVDYFIGDNTAISRSHANIHTDNGEYYIEDTNSTNHTYVNGKLINSNVKVKVVSGDKIRLANEDFTFIV
ncbi:MAG: FHA domain-containing protein [Ruminococcus sp.]|nr:FHA domain-containing protein [Ruminococcus sp.]